MTVPKTKPISVYLLILPDKTLKKRKSRQVMQLPPKYTGNVSNQHILVPFQYLALQSTKSYRGE